MQPPNDQGHIWPWFVGLSVPVVAGVLLAATSNFGATYDAPFYAYYLKQFFQALLVLALSPAILASFLNIPGMAASVAGFGLPSGLGILISLIGWMLIGKGLYALYHSRLHVLFWIIIGGVLAALLVSGYVMTGDYRAMSAAGKTGNVAACANLEGELKGYCLIDAAKFLNDSSICETIPGFQRSSCYNQLGVPYTPLPGMK